MTPMEHIPGPGREYAPIRLEVTDDPVPRILLGPPGEAVDLVPSLIRLEIVVDEIGCRVLVDARADLGEFSFPVVTVGRVGPGLEGLTAADLDAVILAKGMSETPGTALLEYLGSRAAGGAH